MSIEVCFFNNHHDEPSTPRYVRRMFHPGRTGLGGPRPRRGGYMNSGGSSGSGVAQSSSTAASLNNRETIDPIAELLSQLSGWYTIQDLFRSCSE